jgi:glyoxylase-like metal-dependent hydrolase (beta-lactamase superfamily II)
MLVGDIEIFVLTEGFVRLDGGAMFGVVPKPLWEKKFPADERNRIRLAMNCLLIRTAGKQIVVETGAGDKWDAKMRDIYGLEGDSRLPELLASRGTRLAEVDLVINTHLHFDHCGWNTRRLDGKVVPAFPNARYVIQKGELQHAKRPTERDRASYLPENFVPIEENGQFWELEGDREVAPGVEVVRVPGHTRDMQCVRITSRGKTAFFFADLVPTTAHIPYPWIMGYDLYPLTTLENKKRLLPQAVREQWLCLFAHDPNMPVARLQEREGKIIAEPVEHD